MEEEEVDMENDKDWLNKGRNNLGKTIIKARIDLNLSQKQLAEATNISQNYLCLIERGKKFPTYKILEHIAESLGTTPGSLMINAELPSLDKRYLLLQLLSSISSPAPAWKIPERTKGNK